MTDEQKNKMRDDMARSVERMRAKLVDVCTTAADTLKAIREAEGEGIGVQWSKATEAISRLREKLRPEPGSIAWHMEIDRYLMEDPHLRWGGKPLDCAAGTGAVFTTPKEAIDVVLANPPMGDLPDDRQQQADDSKSAQKQGGMVGIKCGPAGIVAWCFEGCHVICEARELGPMSWSISGRVNGTERIYAVVQGGRWATSTYLRLIRNGLVARCRRLKRKRANYAARMAAEAADTVARQKEGL